MMIVFILYFHNSRDKPFFAYGYNRYFYNSIPTEEFQFIYVFYNIIIIMIILLTTLNVLYS